MLNKADAKQPALLTTENRALQANRPYFNKGLPENLIYRTMSSYDRKHL